MHFLVRDGLIVLEPLLGFGYRALFRLPDFLVFELRVGQRARKRIEHRFHNVHNGSHLIGRQLIQQLLGVFEVGIHGSSSGAARKERGAATTLSLGKFNSRSSR